MTQPIRGHLISWMYMLVYSTETKSGRDYVHKMFEKLKKKNKIWLSSLANIVLLGFQTGRCLILSLFRFAYISKF